MAKSIVVGRCSVPDFKELAKIFKGVLQIVIKTADLRTIMALCRNLRGERKLHLGPF